MSVKLLRGKIKLNFAITAHPGDVMRCLSVGVEILGSSTFEKRLIAVRNVFHFIAPVEQYDSD